MINLKETRWKFERAMETIGEENWGKFKRWWKQIIKQFVKANLTKNLRNINIFEKRLRKIISEKLDDVCEKYEDD